MTDALTPAQVFPPGEFLRDEIAERGWTEVEFAEILGRPPQVVSEILNAKKAITPETALEISTALDTSAELWLNLESAYRLHEARTSTSPLTDVERRAALRGLVPVRELQKRGWLPDTKDVDRLESAVCDFLGTTSPDERPTLLAAARRTNVGTDLSPEQTAWIARIRNLARTRSTDPFDRDSLASVARDLVSRLRNPNNLGDLQEILADVGVVLIVELPLKSSKIDGIVFMDEDGRPVIGLSTRGDRMDGFVFTLLHEIAHLVLGHLDPGGLCVDEDLLVGEAQGIEADASALAADWVLPRDFEIGPGKPSMQRIIATAQQLAVHPCFLIGRLQRDGVLAWSDFRRSLPKVRPFVRIG